MMDRERRIGISLGAPLRALLVCVFSLLAASAQPVPQRLVTTAPSQTEALFAMGLGPRVVGVSQYCEWPAQVKSLPRVGSYMRPDVEAITRLRPDLVYLERASNDVPGRLGAVGIRFVSVPHGELKDTYDGINVIAAAAGAPDLGAALVKRIQAGLREVAARAASLPKVRVVVVVDRRPGLLADIVAVGPGNYLNELIETAGGTNVLATAGVPPYPRISLETILRDDPDVIIDLSDAHDADAAHIAARADDKLLWGRETGLKAVRTGHVAIADTTEFVVPGPRSVAAAQQFFTYLHGSR
jgi:iron complex transport system substrate-binding protein